MNRKILVITGERGAGKTQYCLKLLEKAEKEKKTAAGIISPAVYDHGVKTAFHTMDVRTHEQRMCGTHTASEGTIGHWHMDPDVLTWGNDLLKNSCPCDVLFIDELGPLEFCRNEGYTAAFDILRSGDFQYACVVIRPECLEAFRKHTEDFETVTVRG